ncbi:hypothetical protein PTKIN_Ptkin05aG0188000 [Pterospermum kingtungense]
MVLSQSFSSIQLPPTATGPESIAFELGTGRFYVGVDDGRILQYNGPVGGFREFGFTTPTRSKAQCDGTTNPDSGPVCGRPMGLAFHYSTNQLYVCDAYSGLAVLGSDGRLAAPLSTDAEGERYRFCNGLDVHQPSGNVFFIDTSTVHDLRDVSKGLNANDSTGRLLMYNPNTRRVTVLQRNLTGPAGVAVSTDASYVLVSNFNGNSTMRYWLQGPRANTTETINSQPKPNKIKRTILGDFWEAAAMVKQPTQTLVPIGQRISGFGLVSQTVNFEPWYGNNSISEVQEFGGALYIASRHVDFIGIYRFA